MTAPPTRLELMLFLTPTHACSYLPDRDSITAFVDPGQPKSRSLYTLLSHNGFRRSGEHIYRPHCGQCRECVPIRVPVEAFSPRRAQRRVKAANADLAVRAAPPRFDARHFALYQRYVNTRHAGGGMDDPAPEQYRDFLVSSWAETTFYEFLAGERLVAVAVTDRLDDGLSAVYTFFDPREHRRGLGVFAVLWQIEEARRLGLDHVYLGYWIQDCRKMDYKTAYLPHERFVGGRWQRHAG